MFKKKVQPEVEAIKQEVVKQPLPPAPVEEEVEQEEEQQEEETEKELTEEDVVKVLADSRNALLNHEARLTAIESALYRLKALI